MNSLRVAKKDRAYLIYEFAQILQTGNDSKLMVEFLDKNPEVLSDDEYFNKESKVQKMPYGFVGLISPNYNYSINIKHATIAILALLLDINITSGFAATVFSAIGLSTQSIKKLNKIQKCLIAEISLKKHCCLNDLNFENKECVWNNLECDFRKDRVHCSRPLDTIEENIKNLLDGKIIKKENGILKICF